MQIGLPTWSDHLGEVRALLILLPIEAVRICRQHVANGFMSASDVAALAHIPERYASFMLNDKWEEIVSGIEADGDRTTRKRRAN
jgi:hypothetical protein